MAGLTLKVLSVRWVPGSQARQDFQYSRDSSRLDADGELTVGLSCHVMSCRAAALPHVITHISAPAEIWVMTWFVVD